MAAPDKPIDLIQATQRIAWLDEERRRDHAEQARLAQELASVMAILKEQAVKTRAAEDRITAVEASLTRLPRLEDAITSTRSELQPLRDADIRVQDDVQRQARDHQVQADQVVKQWTGINTRLDALSRSIDGVANQFTSLDTQRKAHADRLVELSARLETLPKVVEGLVGRLQLLETREKEHTVRLAELATRLEALPKAIQPLADRLQLLETREKDQLVGLAEHTTRLGSQQKALEETTGRVQLLESREKDQLFGLAEHTTRLGAQQKAIEETTGRVQLLESREGGRVTFEAGVRTQVARIEVAQGAALEEVKRSVARVDLLAQDIQQMGRTIVAAQAEDAKKRQADLATLTEHREAVAAVQREIEEVIEDENHLDARISQIEEAPVLIAQATHRVSIVEEQLDLVQATYKGLQEVEDRHWNTDIPAIMTSVEETQAISQGNAVSVQELVANTQALKEVVRALQVSLQGEHVYGEELAADLRGLIEEDIQLRLTVAQKQLQNLRRLANVPAETKNEETNA